ncbi:MAG: TonB-dependent receptor, partial [Bacteroidales bacterium]|nr:TonB-dependent receptor [Bacteroidales bacterium]
MRNLLILLFITVSQVFADDSYSQNARLNLNLNDVSVETVLTAIEDQSEFYFLCNKKLVDVERNVSINLEDQKINEILNQLFNGTDVAYLITGRQIVLSPKSYLSEVKTTFQPLVIKGTVTDEEGEPMVGVTVMIKGSAKGTVTNLEGNYSIEVNNETDVLVFSFIGMQTVEVPVAGRIAIDVTMSEMAIGMDEVVVVGYGTQKKESITSSVSTVDSEELAVNSTASMASGVLGRLTGITAIQASGAPGPNQTILFVRGMATTGETAPLYVIDGIPRSASDFNTLTPEEVETISVLKDAAAAAVYGARGANGVILVTTKRGQIGVTNFTYSYDFGLQQSTRLPEFLDSYEYANLLNQAYENDGQSPIYSSQDIEAFRIGNDPIFHPNTDWLDIYRGAAPIQKHNLTVNGGIDKIQYFVSLGYLDQKSLFSDINPDLGYDRFNLRSNVNIQASKTTMVSLDLSGYYSNLQNYSVFDYDINYPSITNPPTTVERYPNGLYGPGYLNRNPRARIEQSGYSKSNDNSLLSKLEIRQEIPFVKGLSIKGVAAFDYYPSFSRAFSTDPIIYSAARVGNDLVYNQVGGNAAPSLSKSASYNRSTVLEAHLNYARTFGDHDIAALILYSQQSGYGEVLSGSRRNFLTDEMDVLSAGDSEEQYSSGGYSNSRRRSMVGRLSYNYLYKYLLEFSYRYDGSDLFAEGRRYGFFPSVSAGWNLKEESFLRDVDFIDRLKLRGSWGQLGNDNISGYQYLTFYGMNYVGVGRGTPTSLQNNIILDRMRNLEVTWETSTKTDIGFELNFLDNFFFEFDYFWESRDDILGQRQATIPTTVGTGGTLPFENFMIVDNEGYEITLQYRKVFTNQLKLQSRLNVTHMENTIIDIGETDDVPDRIKQEGRPIGARFGYEAVGIFANQAEIDAAYGENHPNVKPGDIHYKDLNGDKVIDGDDRTYLGTQNVPDYILSWQNVLSFKNFEFNMFWLAAIGGEMDYTQLVTPFSGGGGNVLKEYTDFWTPENTDAQYPRLSVSPTWNFPSDFYLYDASYLRLKNVGLSY